MSGMQATQGGGAGGRQAQAAAGPDSVVRRAADAIGRVPSAEAAVKEVCAAVQAVGTGRDQDQRVLSMVSALEAGPFGADVAILLHQERLGAIPTGLQSMQASTTSVWSAFITIRPWVQRARERVYKREVPEGVDLPALLRAIEMGEFSLAKIVPAKSTGQRRVRAALVAWPLLTQLVCDIYPRDRTAGVVLRRLVVDAFDVGQGNDEGALAMVDKSFAEATLQFKAYIAGTGAPPTWEAIRKDAREELQVQAERREAFQVSADERRAAAAAAKRAEDAAVAAAKAAEGSEGPDAAAAKKKPGK